MSSSSIIIIGAGAAGLQAGRRLSAAGNRVILLEAAPEPGGRILGLTPGGFSVPVEGGAEFIHGPLEHSLRLAKEAGVELQAVRGQMVRMGGGEGHDTGSGGVVGGGEGDDGWEGLMGGDWDRLMEEMGRLKTDLPIADFLAEHFEGARYARLRESVTRFAEGYDLADLRRVSTRALYLEWSREGDDAEEYRVVGGYRQLIDFMAGECRRNGAELHYASPVTDISWNKGRVEVWTMGGRVYGGDTLIVSASLGILGSGVLRFSPVLPGVDAAIKQLGFGSVIKILMEFKQAFWLEKKKKEQTLFVLSDQAIPTWWTQADEDSVLLTGWLAGERMHRFQQLDEDGKRASCLRSLAAIFSRKTEELQNELVAMRVLDWAGAAFVRGGYSYETVESSAARSLLAAGIKDTIWFCGEAFYEGEAPGTVEAALSSGWDLAEKIIAQS
jgi:monoamine oxidase